MEICSASHCVFLEARLRNPEFTGSPWTSALNRGNPRRHLQFDKDLRYLGNGERRDVSWYYSLVESRIYELSIGTDQNFRKWFPQMTMNGITAIVLRYFTEFDRFVFSYVTVAETDLHSLRRNVAEGI